MRGILAKPVDEKIIPSYGIFASQLTGKYQTRAKLAFDLLARERRRKITKKDIAADPSLKGQEGRRWYSTLALDITRKHQDQVLRLLSDARLSEYVNIRKATTKNAAKRAELKSKMVGGDDPIENDVFKAAVQLRRITDQIRKDAQEVGLDVGRVIGYVPRHWNLEAIVDDFGTTDHLKTLLIKHGNADPVEEIPTEKFLYDPELKFGEHIPFPEKGVGRDSSGRIILEGTSTFPETVDQQVFKEYLGRNNAKGFRELARTKLNIPEEKVIPLTDETGKLIPDPNQARIDQLAKELKADAIIDTMINRKFQPFGSAMIKKGDVGERVSFLQIRPLGNIPDAELRKFGFINTDLESIFNNYTYNAATSVSRTKFFGRTQEDFTEKFLIPIRKDLAKAGVSIPEQARIEKGLTKLYQRTTGLDISTTPDKFKGVADFLKLSQMLAHLPFATISSLTEPLIALTRADLPDTNKFIKSFAVASGRQVKKSFGNFFDRMSSITGREIKGFNAIKDSEHQEILEAGLALEQAAMMRIESMYGSGLNTGWAKGVSNLFFNVRHRFIQERWFFYNSSSLISY